MGPIPHADSAHQVETESIVALLQPKKRHGTEMDVTGVPAAAICAPTVSDPEACSLIEVMEFEETQAAVLENSSKRRKENDVTRELMEGAAQKAVGNVMVQLQAQQQFLIDNMNGSVKEAVNICGNLM